MWIIAFNHFDIMNFFSFDWMAAVSDVSHSSKWHLHFTSYLVRTKQNENQLKTSLCTISVNKSMLSWNWCIGSIGDARDPRSSKIWLAVNTQSHGDHSMASTVWGRVRQSRKPSLNDVYIKSTTRLSNFLIIYKYIYLKWTIVCVDLSQQNPKCRKQE